MLNTYLNSYQNTFLQTSVKLITSSGQVVETRQSPDLFKEAGEWEENNKSTIAVIAIQSGSTEVRHIRISRGIYAELPSNTIGENPLAHARKCANTGTSVDQFLKAYSLTPSQIKRVGDIFLGSESKINIRGVLLQVTSAKPNSATLFAVDPSSAKLISNTLRLDGVVTPTGDLVTQLTLPPIYAHRRWVSGEFHSGQKPSKVQPPAEGESWICKLLFRESAWCLVAYPDV